MVYHLPVSPPGFPLFPAAALGLLATENIDGFSYGSDQLQPLGSNAFVVLTYSVDRLTAGIPGSIIAGQVGGDGAAGDKFRVTIRGDGTVVSLPALSSNARLHGLTPLPGESDIDALSLPVGLLERGVYFSIDPATVAAAGARWMIPGGATGAHIFYVPPPIVIPPPPGIIPIVYATPAMLGLSPTDDINAVAILDLGVVGMLDPGDLVYVALARAAGNPIFPPADVIQVFPGPPTSIFVHTSLDLLIADDVDAITAYDPDYIFGDGFEGGDSSAWTTTIGSNTE